MHSTFACGLRHQRRPTPHRIAYDAFFPVGVAQSFVLARAKLQAAGSPAPTLSKSLIGRMNTLSKLRAGTSLPSCPRQRMCRRMTLSVGLHACCSTAARQRDWHVPMPCAHSAVHCCRTLLCHVQKGNGRTQNRETRAALNTPEDLPPLPDSSDRLGLGGQGIGAPVSLGTGRRSDEGPTELALDASLRAIPVDAAAAAVQARSESDPRPFRLRLGVGLARAWAVS
jgi:hypothetical protein